MVAQFLPQREPGVVPGCFMDNRRLYERINVRISAFMVSACVVCIPCGKLWIDFKLAVCEQLILKKGGIFIRDDLIVITLQHRDGNGDSFEIVRLVGF